MVELTLILPPIEAIHVMLISTGVFALVVIWVKILQSALEVILGDALGQ